MLVCVAGLEVAIRRDHESTSPVGLVVFGGELGCALVELGRVCPGAAPVREVGRALDRLGDLGVRFDRRQREMVALLLDGGRGPCQPRVRRPARVLRSVRRDRRGEYRMEKRTRWPSSSTTRASSAGTSVPTASVPSAAERTAGLGSGADATSRSASRVASGIACNRCCASSTSVGVRSRVRA